MDKEMNNILQQRLKELITRLQSYSDVNTFLRLTDYQLEETLKVLLEVERYLTYGGYEGGFEDGYEKGYRVGYNHACNKFNNDNIKDKIINFIESM